MTSRIATPCLMDLTKRLTLEAPVHGTSDGGSEIISWQYVDTVWAALRPTAARAAVSSDARSSHVTHDVWLRYRPDVSGAMRFRLGQRVFAIQGIRDPDERQRWLLCQTDERHA
jgi:SPP1 family predicted phage head-tail adaptor